MKQLKLEVGKTYRNRRGEEVKIVRKADVNKYVYQGSNGEWYTESGRWQDFGLEDPDDLIEEVAEVPETTRHTFQIPDGVKELTVEQVGNRIVVEMVPEAKGPKPGDVMVNEHGSVYVFKSYKDDGKYHKPFVWFGTNGSLITDGWCLPGRPATPEEAQPLWDALKKAGKRWNPKAMKVEDVPEIDRIREWVEMHLEDGHYNQEGIAEVIGHYLKHKEGKK